MVDYSSAHATHKHYLEDFTTPEMNILMRWKNEEHAVHPYHIISLLFSQHPTLTKARKLVGVWLHTQKEFPEKAHSSENAMVRK